jgi:D-alanyl-lipoteichoic acid acyltransferase DltB (MBOAT superfamily)
MLFNSFTFVAFFLVVYTLYLVWHRRLRAQNLLLLVASFIFYGYWDWRFLFLLGVTLVNEYYASHWIARSTDPAYRKRILIWSVGIDLAILGFFKYFDFFARSVGGLLSLVGLHPGDVALHVLLPVGISFYIFQGISYTVDVYRGELEPPARFSDFSLFVSFFPQLVAGPIERATNLMPQILKPRKIEVSQVNAGLFLILWGYFQKVVIADNLALLANQVFNHYTTFNGLDLVIGVLAFAFQIFCDFAGYSDIARGIAKLMGFELMVNFRTPYFALNPSDFWARWHISLSTWLRDYLYIPLGGNRKGELKTYRNLLLTMLLGGLWHGAAWNFVAWGAFHGLLLVGYRALKLDTGHLVRRQRFHHAINAVQMAAMFCFTLVGWVLFRSKSMDQIFYFLGNAGFATSAQTAALAYNLAFFAVPLLLVQVAQYWKRDLLVLTRLPAVIRSPAYAGLLLWIIVFGVREAMEFIYFQF